MIASWIVIVLCAGVWISLDSLLGEDTQPTEIAPAHGPAESPAELQAKPMAGFKDVLLGRLVLTLTLMDGTGQNRILIRSQIAPLLDTKAGPVTNLCGAILLARMGDETAGADADAVIKRVEADPSLAPPAFLSTATIVAKAIRDVEGDSDEHNLTAEQTRSLISSMGWYGELMVSTAQRDESFETSLLSSLWSIMIALIVLGIGALVAGFGGSAWLVFILWKWFKGSLANPMAEPIHTQTTLSWIFAGWFALTILLAIMVAVLGSRAERLLGPTALAFQLGVMFLPLVALALPMCVGRTRASWGQIRRDVGLHCGRGFWREVGYGVTTYATAVPMVVVGAGIAFLLSLVLSQELGAAEHPIQRAIAEGGVGARLMLLFIAAVAAPIVEEIVFRGVLFRHLRELSARWGRELSFVFSALASSLVFAAIHPQGILFIPILGALAFAFCFARETRGSLISCIVAHGINNGVVVALNCVLLG